MGQLPKSLVSVRNTRRVISLYEFARDSVCCIISCFAIAFVPLTVTLSVLRVIILLFLSCVNPFSFLDCLDSFRFVNSSVSFRFN